MLVNILAKQNEVRIMDTARRIIGECLAKEDYEKAEKVAKKLVAILSVWKKESWRKTELVEVRGK